MDVDNTVLNIKTERDDAETADAELNSSSAEGEWKQEITVKVEVDPGLWEEIKQEGRFKPDPDSYLSESEQVAAPVGSVAPDASSPDELSFSRGESEVKVQVPIKTEVDTGVSADFKYGGHVKPDPEGDLPGSGPVDEIAPNRPPQENLFQPVPGPSHSGSTGNSTSGVDEGALDVLSGDEPNFCRVREDVKLKMICKVEVDSSVVDRILNGDTVNIQCSHCDYVCIGETLMAEHVRRRHGHLGHNDDIRNIQCDHCDYVCIGDTVMAKHVRRRHGHLGRNGKYKCTQCEYSGNHLKNLQRHQRTHTGERPYRCDKCAKTFTQKGSLKQHVQSVHDGLRPHVCSDCGKAFTVVSHLNKHRRIHSNTSVVQCEQCGQQFHDRSHYKTHMKAHDGVRAHRCGVCAARFLTRQHLIVHMRIHTGEKPYQCTHCCLRFSRRSDMKSHVITIHTHDYRHRCERCNKGFIAPSVLRKHMVKCTL